MIQNATVVSAIQLTPVGVVHSPIKTPMQVAGQPDLAVTERLDMIKAYRRQVADCVCELVIDPQWRELLDGIDGFSHILVLYWPHLLDPTKRATKSVHPMGREDLPLQGVFATCSPARPNPILVSAVQLLGRNGDVLKVKGLDAVDGSPIIDVKPYSQHYLRVENPRIPAWMEQINRELAAD